jgi:prepilin-type N-terminal cleavage/methylation domain-containing protein
MDNLRQMGFTLLELIVTMSLFLIIGGIAVPQLSQMNSASRNAADSVASFSKQVRARAIASTSAYKMRPSGSGRIITEFATNCSSATWSADQKNKLILPSNTYLLDSTWDLCFNSRGFPDGNLEIDIREQNGNTKTVEIMLGGATRVI